MHKLPNNDGTCVCGALYGKSAAGLVRPMRQGSTCHAGVQIHDEGQGESEARSDLSKKKSGKVPLSANEARKIGRDEGLSISMAIMFSALLDGGFLKPEQMREVWDKVNYLSDSIAKGYVNAVDLRRALQEDYGILI